MSEENIRVAVRVRPFNTREITRNAALIIGMDGNQTTIKNPENMDAEPKKFAFDFSYWSHDGYQERADGYLEPQDPKFADQQRVFNDLGKGILENAWKGYNCSLFAYGQTGSGKSYSMVGYDANKGIVPMACAELFKGIEAKRQKAGKGEDFQVHLSMLEIYNENVRDLLSGKSAQKGLKVRQHPQKGFYVESLITAAVNNYSEIDRKIKEGTRNRTVASTNMNATSSRAHTIVALTFVQKTLNDAGQSMTKTSVINLVDLAGSERAASTGATGDRLEESKKINQSLSTLGNCIAALAANSTGRKKVQVPFRDSTLTKLLHNALGGNSKTVMIAALSPADINYEETLSTLRYADRAKAIKTQAVVNESPTDKLIRELREENARLQELLKKGGISGDAAALLGDSMHHEEVDELKKALAEQMRKNQEELEEMKKTFEERARETEKETAIQVEAERKKQEERKVIPHFWNLNEDPSLTAMVIHFCREGTSKVGNHKASPAPDILLNGLSIQPEHAVVSNKKGTITLKPCGSAKVLVNGQPLTSEITLHHNDRVLFGSNHLYVFHHPQDEAKKLKAGEPLEKPTYTDAQEEIAKQSGLVKGESATSSKEDLLLHDELVELLPLVNGANAMAEELNKKVKFELALISPQARGLKDGRTEVMVKMLNLDNGNEWLLDRNNFVNRRYLAEEMYQNFIEGDKDWDVPQERDPFWEPPTTDIKIGFAHVFLQSLAYQIDFQESLPITDYKGNDHGHLTLEIVPCDDGWKNISEETYIDSPNQMLGKPLNFIIKILGAKGLPRNLKKTYCKFKFYLDNAETKTEEVQDSSNPDYNFEKKCTYKTVTQQLLDYLIDDNLMVEVWGQQKEDGYKSGITGSSDKNRSPSKNVLAHGQSKEGGIQSGQRETLDANTAAATGAVPAVKQSGQGAATATDSSTTVSSNEPSAAPTPQQRDGKGDEVLTKIYELIDSMKASGGTSISIADVEATLAKHFPASSVVCKRSAAPVQTTPIRSTTGPSKGKEAPRNSRACILQ
ncbi:kinesin-like protein KIF28P [Pomacea canaliculata]|uniref:kinesin-like protein KIF28P n=1 Tax=Pomacea canaliculata TaxID=400727 RepID=UPI000D725466|nr:kinesin-like protein KIF28P [Pomacea canaliculata]